jgi:putative DNA primase/helicase
MSDSNANNQRRGAAQRARGKHAASSEPGARSSPRSAKRREAKHPKERGATPRTYSPLLAFPEVDLETVIDCYRKDEWGDALLFARLFEGRCVYDYREGSWYLWQGHYWKPDDTGRVRQLVAGPLASVYLKAAAELTDRLGKQADENSQRDEEDERRSPRQLIKGMVGRAFALRSLSRNKHVLEFATTDHRLTLATEQWDSDPWLLGMREGVLDLRTGLVRDGAPADYIRTVIPTVWRGLDEPAPRFEEFLREVFADRREDERAALIAFLQRALGYGMTGKVTEHIFLFLYGRDGRNGKDTFVGALQEVFGGLVGAVSNDVILASGRTSAPGAAKPHLCALQGKRIAWASEADRGARFDVAQVKFLTGGGTIPARQVYGREYAFEPSHLLLLLTNHQPRADAEDRAFWERFCPITFCVRFVDHPAGPLERKRERELGSVLKSEASGILAWLVRGCLVWQRDGLGIPASVLRERERYRGREDTLASFLEACCTLAPGASVRSSRLFERYEQWAGEGSPGCKLSGTAFGLAMKRQFKQQRDSRGTYYLGVGLLPPDSPSEIRAGTMRGDAV